MCYNQNVEAFRGDFDEWREEKVFSDVDCCTDDLFDWPRLGNHVGGT